MEIASNLAPVEEDECDPLTPDPRGKRQDFDPRRSSKWLSK